jgi:hypothetical protein
LGILRLGGFSAHGEVHPGLQHGVYFDCSQSDWSASKTTPDKGAFPFQRCETHRLPGTWIASRENTQRDVRPTSSVEVGVFGSSRARPKIRDNASIAAPVERRSLRPTSGGENRVTEQNSLYELDKGSSSYCRRLRYPRCDDERGAEKLRGIPTVRKTDGRELYSFEGAPFIGPFNSLQEEPRKRQRLLAPALSKEI